MTDVTERMIAEKALIQSEASQRLLTQEFVRQARHDPLTMLVNRSELTERLAGERAEGERRALISCDLHEFKMVSDPEH